jgi:hypothetical protein
VHSAWRIEGVLDELKTHQRGPRAILRSKTPAMVEQEVWAHLLVHYALRALMHDSAVDHELDPDRLSFTATLRIVRRHTITRAVFSPDRLTVAIGLAVTEILAEQRPPRRLRAFPWVVKRKMRNYHLKRAHHRRWPQPTRPSNNAVVIHPTPAN